MEERELTRLQKFMETMHGEEIDWDMEIPEEARKVFFQAIDMIREKAKKELDDVKK